MCSSPCRVVKDQQGGCFACVHLQVLACEVWSENVSELGSAKLMAWDKFFSDSHLLGPWMCSNNPVVGQAEMGTLPISPETFGFYWKWFYIQWIKRKNNNNKKHNCKKCVIMKPVFACIFYLNCHKINYWSNNFQVCLLCWVLLWWSPTWNSCDSCLNPVWGKCISRRFCGTVKEMR